MNRFAAIRRVLVYTLILNLLAAGAKLAIGSLSGSLSVLADGFDSLLNGASNVVGLAGIYVAARPPDPSHPYGHRRFETLSAVGIAGLLFFTVFQLVQSAINRLRNPVAPVVDFWTFLGPVISIALQSYVALYEYRQGRRFKSELLVADALHTRADVLVSVSVIGGLILVLLGIPRVDPILALLIAAFIAVIGVEILRDSGRILADATALDPAVVERIACSVPGVQTVHKIRSRGQEGDIYLDLHMRVGAGISVRQGHSIAHQVERQLFAEIEGLHDVVVHVEPQEGPDSPGPPVDARIRDIAGRLPGTAVHAIQAHDLNSRLYVTLHLEVERSLSIEQAHDLASQLEGMLQREIPEITDVDIHVEPGGPAGANGEQETH